MFPKNKINIILRLLCLISFVIVIFMINSLTTLLILAFIYLIFALIEKSFRNIELIVITIVLLWISSLIDNYLLFRLMLFIDYCFYYLDTSYYLVENNETRINNKEYIRFSNGKKKEKKGSNNISAIYVTVHLVLLLIAILVG